MKTTIETIIRLWFGPETEETRGFDSTTWRAMQQVSETWRAPSGRTTPYYTIEDKKDFARRVKLVMKSDIDKDIQGQVYFESFHP